MATASDAELVERARAGDEAAFGALYDTWFDRVYDLSFRVVRDPNAAADVAQDAFLAAWRELDGLDDPAAFGGWIRRIARNAALNRRKKDQRARPVDSEAMATIEAAGPSAMSAPAGFRVEDRLGTADDPAQAVEDAELSDLVWEAADALGDRDASVLDYTLRHDMTPAEIAEVIGINRNHANQLVHRVRNRLGDALRARVLWRGGEPVCADLRGALSEAGVTRFGPDAVRVATAHADGCEECSERRRLRLEPSALFAATPFLVAPVALKTRIAHALRQDGVPMQGSVHEGGGAGSVDQGGGVGRARPRWRSARALAIGGAAAIALAAAVVTARAVTDEDGGEPTTSKVVATDPTTTTAAPTTTTAPPAPTSPVLPGTTERPVVAPPPDPEPPPAPVTAELSVTPASKQTPYQNNAAAPVLQWSTSGGASVSVSGPGFSSSAPSGTSPTLCPTAGGAWSICVGSGNATYTLTVRDADGAVVAERSATLTVSP